MNLSIRSKDADPRWVSWRQIESLKSTYSPIRGVKFRRNYGKSAALHTGFGMAVGEVVYTIVSCTTAAPASCQMYDEKPETHERRRRSLNSCASWLPGSSNGAPLACHLFSGHPPKLGTGTASADALPMRGESCATSSGAHEHDGKGKPHSDHFAYVLPLTQRRT